MTLWTITSDKSLKLPKINKEDIDLRKIKIALNKNGYQTR